jgi:hypothetical protein
MPSTPSVPDRLGGFSPATGDGVRLEVTVNIPFFFYVIVRLGWWFLAGAMLVCAKIWPETHKDTGGLSRLSNYLAITAGNAGLGMLSIAFLILSQPLDLTLYPALCLSLIGTGIMAFLIYRRVGKHQVLPWNPRLVWAFTAIAMLLVLLITRIWYV